MQGIKDVKKATANLGGLGVATEDPNALQRPQSSQNTVAKTRDGGIT